jgi:hypothetical protein
MNTSDHNDRLLAKHLADHQQRLVALHMSLQDAYRSRAISKSAYNKRIRALDQAIRLHRQLWEWASAASSSLTQEENLGLPNLEQCTPEERGICLDFMRQRVGVLEELTTQASASLDHITSALSGRWRWYHATIGLSSLRKSIAKIEGQLLTLRMQEREHDNYFDAISKQCGKTSPYRPQQNNLQATIKIFDQLDQLSAKIAQLKQVIASEQQNLATMNTWLDSETKVLEEPLTLSPPPGPEATTKILNAPFLPELQSFQKTRRRLDLAEQYIQNCVDANPSFGWSQK